MTQSDAVRITALNEALLPQILRLEALCFADPWTEGMFRSELAESSCCWLAALVSERLLGYVGMQTVLDEGYISNVAIDPAFQRRGLASLLLETLLNEAKSRKLAFVTLEVRAGNEPAIRLYQKLGFSQVGLRRGYYEKPREDALLMTKYLTEEGSTA